MRAAGGWSRFDKPFRQAQGPERSRRAQDIRQAQSLRGPEPAEGLYFDDIKTTMQASNMRCLTPGMVRRELLLQAIAYNLVRRILLQSAWQHGAPLDQLSFKGTLDTIRHWQHPIAAARGAGAREEALEEMLFLCAADLLPLRPGRREPRVLKRRPKPYQYLTRPRRQMIVSPSRNDKGKPRKSTPTYSLN